MCLLSSVFKLFDFDLEVKPLLQVLVGKTIEQALLEVMEEEELANLRANQYAYEEIRNVELAEVQRLEEQERRHREEKVELPACQSHQEANQHLFMTQPHGSFSSLLKVSLNSCLCFLLEGSL